VLPAAAQQASSSRSSWAGPLTPLRSGHPGWALVQQRWGGSLAICRGQRTWRLRGSLTTHCWHHWRQVSAPQAAAGTQHAAAESHGPYLVHSSTVSVFQLQDHIIEWLLLLPQPLPCRPHPEPHLCRSPPGWPGITQSGWRRSHTTEHQCRQQPGSQQESSYTATGLQLGNHNVLERQPVANMRPILDRLAFTVPTCDAVYVSSASPVGLSLSVVPACQENELAGVGSVISWLWPAGLRNRCCG
jgi:hypothetical protein